MHVLCMSSRIRLVPAVCLVLAAAPNARAQNASAASSELERGFVSPPDAAKPRVWWHWMNGNVTKEGITADLEWMKRVGIGGFQMFDGGFGVPQFTDERLVWMTPKWKEAFHHAGAEASRLGLEMAIAASGGWSETGGPWVTPQQAMKKVVWSDTTLRGPAHFTGALPKPPSNNGLFQNAGMTPSFDLPEATQLPGAKPSVARAPAPPDPTFYADTKVFAVRTRDDDVRMRERRPRVTSSAAGVDLAALTDGDIRSGVTIPYEAASGSAWIQLDFDQPFRAQAFTFSAPPGGSFFARPIPAGELQASDDGTRWTTLVSLPGPGHPMGNFMVRTYAFAPATARHFRVLLKNPSPPAPASQFTTESPRTRVVITELELSGAPRVNRWEEKAQFGNIVEYGAGIATPATSESIPLGDVLDLTARMRADGSLDWQVPAGRWTVLRMGYSLTGKKNHPATIEATGFEVDKLSRAHVTAYAKRYADLIGSAMGAELGKGLRYMVMDSWEAGLQNWTDDILAQFRARRGYDAAPYLPVLTGRVVAGADASDRFLWDWRRTIADLLAENHYGAMSEYLRTRGVGLYAEAVGAGLMTTGDGLQTKGHADIPMGEFWTPAPGVPDRADHPADLREAASAAHVYGKPFAASESFTTCNPSSYWSPPSYLKQFADNALALGINRFVIHTSDHQPFVDAKHRPGITLGPCGIHYTRNNTWAEQAAAFNAYLGRASFMLQQGAYVADVAYFYGENAPVSVPFWKDVRPVPPAGYAYDFVNADVLLNRASVRDGRLALRGGMSYRVLVLQDGVDRLTLPMLRKLRDLVAAGVTLVGARPGAPPSLSGGARGDVEARAIVDALWGSDAARAAGEHAFGKGMVTWGRPIADVLASRSSSPDVRFTAPGADSTLVWIHRRTGDADIYFVANQRAEPADVAAIFRVAGRAPELWRPDTGEREPAEYRIESGRTTVPLRLDAYGSVFVVFRGATSVASRALPAATRAALTTLAGPWQVSFPPDLGAPARARFDSLGSWTASADPGIKYFSGTASYARELDVEQTWLRPGARILLDLGAVKEIAEVTINGSPVGGVLWKPPYSVDATRALHAGRNRVEVKVTNLWVNRIVGDAQPSATTRYTFLGFPQYSKDTPLLESGLIGPVRLLTVTGGAR
jgi:hypothetical protein